MPFKFDIEGPETRKARELTQALQEAQLQRYQQEEQVRQQIQERQVLPFEDFKINVDDELIPFKALPPEQKMQWAKQREMDWRLAQQAKYTESMSKLIEAENELEKNLQKRSEIKSRQASWMGGEKPGPDWMPGAFFGKPYEEQLKAMEASIASAEQKRNIAGMRAQFIQDQQMPQTYGMPPITKPQPAQQAPQAQPQAQQAPAQQQAEIPSYADEAAAKAAGAKVGDIIILQNVKKADGTVGPAKVRLTR